MGTAVNGIVCNKCQTENGIVLEWLSKYKAIEEIKKTKCGECGSDDWSFTDDMGQ